MSRTNDLHDELASIQGRPFFTSWSGGKDSGLALYRAMRAGGRPECLLTMLAEGGQRSRSHGLSQAVLLAQAEALCVPLVTRETSWERYESQFVQALGELKQRGVEAGVFGDIDVDEHREWVEQVCARAGVIPFEPLWNGARQALLDEFIRAGFSAMIVAVRDGCLDPAFLGRVVDRAVIQEFEHLGIDASGENGEYHTVVVHGPLFDRRLQLETQDIELRDGTWFLDLAIRNR